LGTTQVYTHVSQQQLAATYLAAHPRAQLDRWAVEDARPLESPERKGIDLV
jgi:hypothetical protein